MLTGLMKLFSPVHDDCDGSESQCNEETDCYGVAGVLDVDLLTEEGSSDG